MTKGKLAAKFVWTIVFAVFAVLFLALSTVVWDIKFLGNSATSLYATGTYPAWANALSVLYRPVTDVIIGGLFNPANIVAMFSATYWSNIMADNGLGAINYITLFLFLAIIIVYLIEFIVNLVRVFTHHKPSLLLNIIWYAMISFLMMYAVALLHVALFGDASSDFTALSWQNGPFFHYLAVTLFTRTGTPGVGNNYLDFAQMQANGLTFVEVIGGWLMLVMFWVFMIFALVVYIKGFVLIGRCIGYTKAHKYDYIVKREMKAKAKYYRDHGFENGKDRAYREADEAFGNLPYPYANNYPYGGNVVSTGNNAPLIVQYLNSEPKGTEQGILGTRQPAIQVQNPQGITKDDLKLAIMEVLNAQKDQPHVVVNQPAAKEDDGYYLDEGDYDILTEAQLNEMIREAVEAKEAKPEPLTKEDVKKIIAESLEEREEKCECDCGCHCCEPEVDEAVAEEEPVEEAPVCEEKPAVIPPIIVSIPTKIEDEEVEEEAAEEETEDRITEEDLRELVKAQILEALKDVKVNEEVKEVRETRYVDANGEEVAAQEAKPEPAAAPKAAPAPKAEPAKPAEAPKAAPAPKAEPTVKKVVKPVPPVRKASPIKQPQVRGRETQLEKEELENKSFTERVVAAEDDVKLAYNELKNLLVSYGLKDRISSNGDTFRAHKVTYCKMSMSGSSLKLHLALDPKNYSGSALPIDDASSKEAYKDIPLVFRVKSDLSLRRARDLINDMMRNHGVAPAEEVPAVDYVAEMKKELRKAARAAKAAAKK